MTHFPSLSIPLAIACVAIAAPAQAQLPAPREKLTEIAKRKDLTKAREKMIEQAVVEAAKPVIRRPADFEALMNEPQASMKYEDKPSHQEKLSEEEWHRFALSLGDANINGELSSRLPRIAAAYSFNGDPKLEAYVIAQLKEMSTWIPIERPGSIQTRMNITPMPWLGTGWGIRAVIDTLDILPEKDVPAGLRQKFSSNLEKEILNIREAWNQKRLWYTKEGAAYSNQWVVPMEGLVRASIFTGIEKHRDDYEFGVKNLLSSLNAQGTHGEFAEGVSYSGITMNALLSAAEATARIGDKRLIDHPYFRQFPIWYAHHLQPGGEIINAFDSKVAALDPALLSRFVAVIRSSEALWAIQRNPKGPFGNTLWGVFGHAEANFEPKEPPLFAAYDFAARINWRDSWDDKTAAGFWMRGGHRTDAHDHQDRGHISFSIGNRPLLIEAGLVSYGIPKHVSHFRSVAGHNVLQIGDFTPDQLTIATLKKAGQIQDPPHRSAPITVEKMDASGGSASVDMSGCYDGLDRWVRHVTWDHNGVKVRDEVVLKNPDTVLFRWHLGAAPDATKTIGKDRITVDGIEVAFDANSPLKATVDSMPNFDSKRKEATDHACVVIRSAEPVKSFTLNSSIHLAK